jgi:hypothetical protein
MRENPVHHTSSDTRRLFPNQLQSTLGRIIPTLDIGDPSNQSTLRQSSQALVDLSAGDLGDLRDQHRGDDFMVFRALFDCGEHAEFVRGNIAEISGVELHGGVVRLCDAGGTSKQS